MNIQIKLNVRAIQLLNCSLIFTKFPNNPRSNINFQNPMAYPSHLSWQLILFCSTTDFYGDLIFIGSSNYVSKNFACGWIRAQLKSSIYDHHDLEGDEHFNFVHFQFEISFPSNWLSKIPRTESPQIAFSSTSKKKIFHFCIVNIQWEKDTLFSYSNENFLYS